MRIIFKIWLLVVMTFVFLSCTACQEIEFEPSFDQRGKYEVQLSDLPPGWKFRGEDVAEQFGAPSHLVAFGIDNDNIIRLTHTISIYPDQEQAKTAYVKWDESWFGAGAWQPWPGADFVPSDVEDEYKFECISVEKGLISCNYLQRHEHLISFVLVNFRENIMTFVQLNHILKIVDERLNTP